MVGRVVGTVLDERNQRLFATDGGNNRILVWDIEPSRLTPTPDPMAVLGQQDLNSRIAGSGVNGLNNPRSIFYDDANDRLFVVDQGNNRVLVFDARPGKTADGCRRDRRPRTIRLHGDGRRLGGHPDEQARPAVARSVPPAPVRERCGQPTAADFRCIAGAPGVGAAAAYVFGQDDFNSSKPRTDGKKAWGLYGPMDIDTVRQRLYLTEPIARSRTQVFDIDPRRIHNNPDAIAIMFQHDTDSVANMVSRDQETWPRPFLDAQRGKLYVANSHPGRNGISFYDISGKLPQVGLAPLTELGQVDGDGKVDFSGRPADGRATGHVLYPRSIVLDPVDHRLFAGDQYNNRVLMFQLDPQNRVLDRNAAVMIGEPDKLRHQHAAGVRAQPAYSVRNGL